MLLIGRLWVRVPTNVFLSFLLFLSHLFLYFVAPTAKMFRISMNLVLLVLHKIKMSLF